MNDTSPGYLRIIPLILVALTALASPAFSEDIKALTRKAESGDPEAQYMLGNAYYCGTMVQRNYSEAVKWYRRAAEQEDPDARSCLPSHTKRGMASRWTICMRMSGIRLQHQEGRDQITPITRDGGMTPERS